MAKHRKDRKPRLRRRWKWLIGIAIFLLVSLVVSVEVTSRSEFCGTCHIMEPYYVSWTQDAAHHDVQCVECHIAPGTKNYVSAKLNGLGQVVDDVLDRTSTKPSASVSEFACLREGCHLVENLKQPTNKSLPYFFDHRKHLNVTYRGVEIECTTCHSHVEGYTHFEVNTNVCITCHLHEPAANGQRTGMLTAAKLESVEALDVRESEPEQSPDLPSAPNACTACHAAPSEPIEFHGMEVDHSQYLAYGAKCESCHRNVTASAPPITDAQCLTCHVFGVDRMDDTDELHRVHAEGKHKVECYNCHGITAHGPDAAVMSLGQIDCRGCHVNQHDLQRLAYVREDHAAVEAEQPLINPMFLAHVDCNGCHIKPREVSARPGAGATVKVAVPEACDACHQPGFGELMIGLWQRTTRQKYDETMALMPEPGADWANDPAAQQAINRAHQLLEQVRVDGSWGVHNPKYTQGLIEQARQQLIEARRAGGEGAATGGAP